MFFILSKTIGVLLIPSNLIISIGFVGLILTCSRYRSFGRRLLVICVAGLVVCGFFPIGSLLLIPIEDRFPAWSARNGEPDGIVVLGGGTERIVAAIGLARQYPRARIVFTGGNANWIRNDDVKEADIAARFFDSVGIDRYRLTLETQARNTQENAEFSKAIAAPKPGDRWLLVTSASHMPRSMGIFRKIGFPVEPYPVDWKTKGWNDLLEFQSRFSDGIVLTDIAAREWMGLIAYRLIGRTGELLPSAELESGESVKKRLSASPKSS